MGKRQGEHGLPVKLLHPTLVSFNLLSLFVSFWNTTKETGRRKLVEQSHSHCFNTVTLSQSDNLNCCVWRVCIESRLAERITGVELGWWLVDSSQLLWGPYSITTLTRVWYGQGVGSQKVLLCSWFLSKAHRQTPAHTATANTECDQSNRDFITIFWYFCRQAELVSPCSCMYWQIHALLDCRSFGWRYGWVVCGNSLQTVTKIRIGSFHFFARSLDYPHFQLFSALIWWFDLRRSHTCNPERQKLWVGSRG